MFSSVLKLFVIIAVGVTQTLGIEEKEPLYKYRYETEDMMKTSATSVPLRGYHVVEGGYYPQESGPIGSVVGPIGVGGGVGGGRFIGGPIGYGGVGGAGIGLGAGGGGGHIGLGAGGIGLGGAVAPIGVGYGGHHLIQGGGIGVGGLGGGIGAAGLGGGIVGGGGGVGYVAPIVHGYGGEAVEKSQFSGGKKNLEDAKFEKAHGQQGGSFNQGQSGYSQGAQLVKDVKGEEGYYKNAGGAKNLAEDGKQYHGGQAFNQEGKNGVQQNFQKGHKKGHKIKGFKTSHHKDETGKTEEYYDEELDEGSNLGFHGQSGAFGQKGATSFKGGHEDGKFNEVEQKKIAQLSNQYALNKENANQGKFGENKYAGQGQSYGVNNGIDQQSLLGHQENSKFVKHHPVPFYHY